MKIKSLFALIVVSALSLQTFGQADSTKKALQKIRPIFITIQDIESLKQNFQKFDTSLTAFNQLNPYRKQGIAYQDLGSLGSPSQALQINGLKPLGLNFGFNTMQAWQYPLDGGDDKLIIAPNAYTKLNYAQGDKELIFIELLHTQNITKRWNYGLDYRRLKTNNYLYYQLIGDNFTKIRLSNIYNVKLFSSFRSKSDQYYALGSLILNKSNIRETGGLSSPFTFDTTAGKLRVFNNPLVNATNTLVQPALHFTHYYRFGKTELLTQQKDSNLKDTLGINFKPKSYLFHTLNASHSLFQFKDPMADTPYYKPHFINGINDSMVFKVVSNSVGFCFQKLQKNLTHVFKASTDLSNYGIFNSIIGQMAYNNLSLRTSYSNTFASTHKTFSFNALGHYFIAGYNKDDYLLQGETYFLMKDKITLSAKLSTQKHQADHFQNIGFTSPIKWNQRLVQSQRHSIVSTIEWIPLKLKVGIMASKFQNFILYYPNAAPMGIDFNYLHLFASHHLKIKAIQWINSISYQECGQTYHLPKLSISGSIFIENRFFKKNMLARIGMDYQWNSAYFADLYDPSIRQFVWQNSTRIGSYPFLDFYMSAQVQTMNLFIRFEHLNQGFSGNRYYSTPNYPNPPRFLRFGVSWRLFN